MENFITVYFVTEKGTMNPVLVGLFLDMFKEKGYSIRDIGMGSAYNMPVYLLGEIEEHYDEAVVVSAYQNGDEIVPMVFFSADEIDPLFEGLENAEEGMDTFDILRKVHKEIRS